MSLRHIYNMKYLMHKTAEEHFYEGLYDAFEKLARSFDVKSLRSGSSGSASGVAEKVTGRGGHSNKMRGSSTGTASDKTLFHVSGTGGKSNKKGAIDYKKKYQDSKSALDDLRKLLKKQNEVPKTPATTTPAEGDMPAIQKSFRELRGKHWEPLPQSTKNVLAIGGGLAGTYMLAQHMANSGRRRRDD